MSLSATIAAKASPLALAAFAAFATFAAALGALRALVVTLGSLSLAFLGLGGRAFCCDMPLSSTSIAVYPPLPKASISSSLYSLWLFITSMSISSGDFIAIFASTIEKIFSLVG